MNQKELISALKEVKKDLVNRYGIKEIAIFGSYAHGTNNEKSDVDLLIFSDQKNYFKLIEMENYLSSLLNKKVDLGFFDGMNSFIKKEIKKDIIYVV